MPNLIVQRKIGAQTIFVCVCAMHELSECVNSDSLLWKAAFNNEIERKISKKCATEMKPKPKWSEYFGFKITHKIVEWLKAIVSGYWQKEMCSEFNKRFFLFVEFPCSKETKELKNRKKSDRQQQVSVGNSEFNIQTLNRKPATKLLAKFAFTTILEQVHSVVCCSCWCNCKTYLL